MVSFFEKLFEEPEPSPPTSPRFHNLLKLPEPDPPINLEFHKFLELPTELQLQIYKEAYANGAPRTILLTNLVYTKTKGNQYVEGQLYTPALLQVCKRSREECLSLYTQILETTPSEESPKETVYVNFAVDKLRIIHTGDNFFLSGGYRYNLSEDAIVQSQHFEIVVASGLRTIIRPDIERLFLITDDIARYAQNTVISFTAVISVASRTVLDRHRVSKAWEEQEKARIREELGMGTRWGKSLGCFKGVAGMGRLSDASIEGYGSVSEEN